MSWCCCIEICKPNNKPSLILSSMSNQEFNGLLLCLPQTHVSTPAENPQKRPVKHDAEFPQEDPCCYSSLFVG